ncbi:unnamed protein product [Lymnaea stagnalis]|uniref:Uncharacterized protein n=1 Tax=Lymnaea stagnalis TaxID=6523 RepID=A0AAV2H1X9_LYMST
MIMKNGYLHQLLHQTIVIIIFIHLHLTNGEIHRAKSNPLKNVKRASASSLSFSDLEADTDVAKMLEQGILQQDDAGGGTIHEIVDTSRNTYEIWIFSILAAILVGLSGIFPLLVIPLESGQALKHGEPAKKLRLMLSFAVGSLLGDVFLHLLPEVWAHIDSHDHASHRRVGLWVISGLLAFMIIEKLMGDENEFEHLEDTCDEAIDQTKNNKIQKIKNKTQIINNKVQSKPKSPTSLDQSKQRRGKKENIHKISSKTDKLKKHQNGVTAFLSNNNNNNNNNNSKIFSKEIGDNSSKIKVSGYLNLMANIIDNFTHGLAVAGSFCISTKVGLITTLAILLHEIPHEVGDFAILLRSGFNRWRAAKAQFFTASGGVVGAITALSAESAQVAGERSAWILPFTSGGFLYIALVTVVPDLLQEKHGWESLKQVCCICLGMLSMILVTLLFD